MKKYFFLFILIVMAGGLNLLLTGCTDESIRHTMDELFKPGGTADQPQKEQGPPAIIYFRSDKPFVMAGDTAKLEWRIDNAVNVDISGIGQVPPSGSRTVDPSKNQFYTLVARNASGQSVSSEVHIGVGYPQVIDPDQPESDKPIKVLEPVQPELKEPIKVQPKVFTPVKIMMLQAPKQVSPVNGAKFSHYPRKTTLRWQGVGGAASYTVEVDCLHCCKSKQWCTDVGKTYKVVPSLKSNSYTFNFAGAQPGRWRIWAVDKNGKPGMKSSWRTFTYTR